MSVVNYTRSAEETAAATISYRENQVAPTRRSSSFLIFCVVALAIGATVSIVWYSRLTKPKPTVQDTATPPPLASSQQSEVPQTQSGVPLRNAPVSHSQTQSRLSEQVEETPASTGPNVDEFLAKAQAALSRGDWTEPANDNALKWARQARTYGSKEGEQIEDQIYKRLLASVDEARKAKDYPSAVSQVSQMIHLFPNHTSLPTLRTAIQREEAESRSK